MPEAKYPLDPKTLLIDTKSATVAAKLYADTDQTNRPYNYIGIQDFLPSEILDKVITDLDELPEPEDSFLRAQENNKTAYIPERLPTYTRNLFYALNSRPFIMFLERLTGIEGLIPDPYFSGAGVHQVGNGGHLDIHAGFNHHHDSILNVD